ncbi:MAG: hypothetical protein LBK58_16270 [Prevotellaceae bacterium]|jgi:formylglycine-generating enzyme required for sulfatase activity|nr:hypothetical protein [Prevotellaceae bacterium]
MRRGRKEIKKEGSIAAVANTFENGVLKSIKTMLISLSAVMCLFFTVICAAQPYPAEPEMVKADGGTFRMGCTDEQGDWLSYL